MWRALESQSYDEAIGSKQKGGQFILKAVRERMANRAKTGVVFLLHSVPILASQPGFCVGRSLRHTRDIATHFNMATHDHIHFGVRLFAMIWARSVCFAPATHTHPEGQLTA